MFLRTPSRIIVIIHENRLSDLPKQRLSQTRKICAQRIVASDALFAKIKAPRTNSPRLDGV
jgi:hypothetical protein